MATAWYQRMGDIQCPTQYQILSTCIVNTIAGRYHIHIVFVWREAKLLEFHFQLKGKHFSFWNLLFIGKFIILLG